MQLQLTTRVVPRHEMKWRHSVHTRECGHFISWCARGLLALGSCINRVDGADVRESTLLKRKTLTSWRAVLFMSQFVQVPAAAVAWARQLEHKHAQAWAAYDATRTR